MGQIARTEIGVLTESGRVIRAPVERWLAAILKSLDRQTKARVFEAVETMVLLEGPRPAQEIVPGVGALKSDVVIPAPTVTVGEPKKKNGGSHGR